MDFSLGSAPGVLSTGELVSYSILMRERQSPDLSRAARYCSCGKPLVSCDLWARVDADFSSTVDLRDFGRLNRLYGRSWSLPVVLIARGLRLRGLEKYSRWMEYLVRLAAKHSGSQTIVDSSKFPSRAFLYLFRREDIEVRFVHLVRDGLSYLQSSLSHADPGRDVSPPHARPAIWSLRFCLEWLSQNLLASLLGFVFRDRYRLVRYEDFVSEPSATLRALGDFLNIDVGSVCSKVERGQALRSSHIIAENRSKFNPVLRIESRGGPIDSAEKSLIFLLTAGWLRSMYGYPLPIGSPSSDAVRGNRIRSV